MLGSTVSHYKILEKIGAGGMGEVYLAEDTKLRRKVSLKFLSEELTRDEERKQRFIQEARAAASVEHPHIAAIYDIDEADGRTFIAIEYVRGESLRETINAGKLNLRRSLELGHQIADGLAKAHERGVVHRDVKPENILVSEDGYAKIIDFGLAKLLEPIVQTGDDSEADTATHLKTREGMVMGTVSYMSPEQARGASVDARSDVFSFGIVLYEMLSGESPFRKASLAESLGAVLHTTPPALNAPSAAIPPELQRVLKKALAKEPGDRYQTMKDLAIDLRNLREESTSTTRTALVEPPSRTRWVFAVGVAAAVVVAAGLAFFLSGPSSPPGIGASGRPAIAVMYFESMSGDEEVRWLSKGLPNMLITDLAQTPGLDVVSSQRIQKILKQIGQEDLESLDESVVEEVARQAGAGAVVMGSIFKSGDEIRLDVQVQDVESGRVLSAESVRGEDVFLLVDEITGRIRTSLSLGDRPEGRPLAEVTTASLEAFQLYSEGLEASNNFRWADARQSLEEAVEVDPSFAMALLALSRVSRSLGQTGIANQYFDRAREHIDDLPERQRLLVQAVHAWEIEGEPERAEELYETLVTRYPDEETGHVDLSFVYDVTGQGEKALAALERGLEALPDSGPIHNAYGYRLIWAGRYPEGVRALETYAELEPDEANPHDSLAEAYLMTGQPEQALEEYARTLELDPSFYISHRGRAWAFGMLGRFDEALDEWSKVRDYEEARDIPPTTTLFMNALTLSRVGRYHEAEENLKEGIELAEQEGNVGGQVALELLSAAAAIERGHRARTLQDAKRAQEIISHSPAQSRWMLPTHLLAGVAEARSGDIEAARTQLRSLEELYHGQRAWENWFYHALSGEIALATGDLSAAESAFAAGEPEPKMFFINLDIVDSVFNNNLPFRDGPARVKKAQEDLAGAIRIYRRLNKADMGSKWTAMLEPRYVLELARLLDESGDTEGARAEYERFLEYWKDADEGLPELEEARAYLAQ